MKLNINDLIVKLTQDKKQTMLVFGGIVAVFAGVYLYMLLIPLFQTISKTRIDIRTLREELKGVNESIGKEDMLKKKIASMNQTVSSYEKKLPTEREMPTILEEIARMARDTNVKIIGISPLGFKANTGGEKMPYQEAPISITARGGYHEIGKFINKLENGSRFVSIADIMISGENEDKRVHSLELVASTYILLRENI